MEFHHKKSLFNLIDHEEKNTMSLQSPSRLSIKTDYEMYEHDLQFRPAVSLPCSPGQNPTSTLKLMPAPPSPESPWTLSPLRTPSPSLLYHCIASLYHSEGTVYSIAVSKGLIFTGSGSSRIRAWRQPGCMECACIKSTAGDIRAMLVHGNMLFAANKDHKIRMWNFTAVSDSFRFKKVSSFPRRSSSIPLLFSRTNNQQRQHKDCVSCLAYYHAGGLLYTGSYDRTVKAWRVSNAKCVDSFVAHEDKVNAIVVNQDDGCVFTCSSDGSVKIWRRVYGDNSHTLTLTLNFQTSPVNTIVLSSTRSCGHRFAVLCLAAVGNLVFSGSEDTTIRIWKREEGNCLHECLAVLEGHRGPVRCLAACLEMGKVVMGFLVYSASLEKTFKVWRVKVLPDDREFTSLDYCVDPRSDIISMTKSMESEMNPVLSPSWVKRKLSR
ncbi:hypothetical protein FNV43_RR11223 [Rhamnella rubrinervis]|uniref:Uncharacterized protein n=1 Tax=Rhamnella rubrinervis TaxID=2594499 RepID=A0A8K0MHN4_9ROSA|nr:hypothetical protein FNV43_RR11223 [Rhamnella rubrinervis]